jgi:hypothetical protein
MPYNAGDTIYIFNLTNINQGPVGYGVYQFDNLNSPPFDLGGSPGTNKEPAVVVGQGYWYKSVQTGGTAWNQTFSVN